ncbi:polysialyltransferase family glycosyltransferase [Pontibacter sp. 13R65]|uniref:polysialyltransferase family glycosyltransferase n=1 Tax=Pontibacter sp. 13R65 TaxID=3127458 RepID=UPI00301E26BF
MEHKHYTSKQTLLLVYNFNRSDFLSYFRVCKADFIFFFAEFASPDEVFNRQFAEYGQAIFWGNFKNAFDLLEKIKPDKVLFLYIESYFHMALNIACKVKGIPTFLLDHGIQDSHVHKILKAFTSPQKRIPKNQLLFTKLKQIPARIKARQYLINTINILPPKPSKALRIYCSYRKKEHYISVLKKLEKQIYYPDAYISISPVVASAQKKLLGFSFSRTHYFGIPTFDHLVNLSASHTPAKNLIFIDQGLATAGFLGWTSAIFESFTQSFAAICLEHGYRVFVKKHPRQPNKDWGRLAEEKKVIVIDDDTLANLLPTTKIIVGFFSTYLLPLIAMEHTTVLTLENHPVGNLNVSKSFIEAGVAQPVYNLQELEWALEHINMLHQQQMFNKAKFTREWLYKFDGKSGERLREILLQEK